LSDAAKLAQGIARILRATLIGLLIAIPSLIAWSYFSKKVEVLAVEMEALCDDFIRRQYAESGSGVLGSGSQVLKSKSMPTPDPKP
jgi:biopolymer transport protein ExbB